LIDVEGGLVGGLFRLGFLFVCCGGFCVFILLFVFGVVFCFWFVWVFVVDGGLWVSVSLGAWWYVDVFWL